MARKPMAKPAGIHAARARQKLKLLLRALQRRLLAFAKQSLSRGIRGVLQLCNRGMNFGTQFAVQQLTRWLRPHIETMQQHQSVNGMGQETTVKQIELLQRRLNELEELVRVQQTLLTTNTSSSRSVSKSHVPNTTISTIPPELQKFARMKTVGVPQAAIIASMIREGYSPTDLFPNTSEFRSHEEEKSSREEKYQEEEETKQEEDTESTNSNTKYDKMRKAGVPEAAIALAMKRDGVVTESQTKSSQRITISAEMLQKAANAVKRSGGRTAQPKSIRKGSVKGATRLTLQDITNVRKTLKHVATPSKTRAPATTPKLPSPSRAQNNMEFLKFALQKKFAMAALATPTASVNGSRRTSISHDVPPTPWS